MNKPARPLRGFIIYSREDKEHLSTLLKHLAPLVQEGWLEPWSDRRILAGDCWEAVLEEELETAHLILTLVSADFNASEFIQNRELKLALEREARGETRIVPILVRPTYVKLSALDRFQWLPRDRRPVTQWGDPDAPWVNIVEELVPLLSRLGHGLASDESAHDDVRPGRAPAATTGAISAAPPGGPVGAATDGVASAAPLSTIPAAVSGAAPAVPIQRLNAERFMHTHETPPRLAAEPVVSINALHFSDLHVGLTASRWLWPNVSKRLFEDLTRLHEQSGPWHLLLFTGDLVQTGHRDEFRRLDEELERIFDHIYNLQGYHPLLLAVPGNHDLQRPADEHDPSALTLKQCHGRQAIDGLRDRLYGSGDVGKVRSSGQRSAIETAFAPYIEWSERWNRGHTPHPRLSVAWSARGLMPGDFSASITYQDLRLGVVGLNTAALQLLPGDYQGLLDADPRQLVELCGERYTDWFDRHDACLLLTHHPPDWLHAEARRRLEQEIAPSGRFLAHLYGHVHAARATLLQVGGSRPRREWQGASLFGLEQWGDPAGVLAERVHGYSAIRISLGGRHGRVHIWPRTGRRLDGGWKLVPDVDQNLDEGGAIVLEVGERLKGVTGDAAPVQEEPAVDVTRNRDAQVATHLDRTFQWKDLLLACAERESGIFVLFGHWDQRPHHMLERLSILLSERSAIPHRLVPVSPPLRGWPDTVEQWEQLILTAIRASGGRTQGSFTEQLRQAASDRALMLYNRAELYVLSQARRDALARFLVERLLPHLATAAHPIRILLTLRYDEVDAPDGMVQLKPDPVSDALRRVPRLIQDCNRVQSGAGELIRVLKEIEAPSWDDIEEYLRRYYGSRYSALQLEMKRDLKRQYDLLCGSASGAPRQPHYHEVCDILTRFIERHL